MHFTLPPPFAANGISPVNTCSSFIRRTPLPVLIASCVLACSSATVSEKTNSGTRMPDGGVSDASEAKTDGATPRDASGSHPEASPPDATTSDGADATKSCMTTLAAMTCGDAGATGWCCPALLPAADAGLVPCSYFGPAGWYGPPIEPSIASCGDTRLVVLAFGNHGISCFYSASTGVLTGASEWQDTWYFCNGTSSVMSAGDVDWSCAYSYSQLACISDGGAQ